MATHTREHLDRALEAFAQGGARNGGDPVTVRAGPWVAPTGRRFVDLPWRLYRGDRYWVPPLKASVRELLDVQRHPFYDGGRERGDRALPRLGRRPTWWDGSRRSSTTPTTASTTSRSCSSVSSSASTAPDVGAGAARGRGAVGRRTRCDGGPRADEPVDQLRVRAAGRGFRPPAGAHDDLQPAATTRGSSRARATPRSRTSTPTSRRSTAPASSGCSGSPSAPASATPGSRPGASNLADFDGEVRLGPGDLQRRVGEELGLRAHERRRDRAGWPRSSSRWSSRTCCGSRCTTASRWRFSSPCPTGTRCWPTSTVRRGATRCGPSSTC